MTNRRGLAASKPGPPLDADTPVAGCYAVRLVKDGPPVALRICYGPPLDPWTGEELDRAPRWLAFVNGGEAVDVFRFWPACASKPISRELHDHICQRSRTMDPSDPYFDPLKPVNLSAAPMPFGVDLSAAPPPSGKESTDDGDI
jgi:hypothetical protein